MPVQERALQLPLDEGFGCEFSYHSESDFEFNHIAHKRTLLAGSRLGGKLMPVFPVMEWAVFLRLDKMGVPSELSDAGDPLRPEWQKREHAKRRDDA